MTINIREQWNQSSKIEKILVSTSILGVGITTVLIPLDGDERYIAGAILVVTALSSIIGYGISEYRRYQGRII